MRLKTLFLIAMLTIPLSAFAGFRISDLKWANDVGARKEPSGRKTFVVNDFGAVADGRTMNTKAIQSAIDACRADGGGVVTFAPGSYLTGSIYLKEGVHLVIPEGVTILGSQLIADYPDIPTRVAGIEMIWSSALINVIGEKNVMISGKGKIDGQGKPFWDNYWEMRRTYEAKGLRWIVDYDCKRPRTLLVSEAEDITVRDVTFKKAGFWTIHLLYSRYCTVDGVIVRNNIGGHGPSTDGIDIDSSSHILVENCDIDCNDDNFCLKAGRDADGLRVNRPTEYVVIRHCVSRAGGGLFTCGSETSGGIRYVLAHDLRAKGTSVGLRFKSAMNRGGTTEHIYLKDIVMEEVGTAIEATMNWNPSYSYSALPEEFKGKELPPHWVKMLETVDPPELGIPRFNNIHFSGITVHKARRALSVEGSEQSKMEHFSLNDITINAEHAGSVKHAEYWRMKRIDIRSEDNLPIQVTESKEVSFPEESNVYLFSYFTGNGEDGLHLAYSFNGLSWKPLNNGESLLKPMVGKDRLMRDPSITRGEYVYVYFDKYTEKKYGTIRTKDGHTWEDVSEQILFPRGTRHGTAFTITGNEFEKLKMLLKK